MGRAHRKMVNGHHVCLQKSVPLQGKKPEKYMSEAERMGMWKSRHGGIEQEVEEGVGKGVEEGMDEEVHEGPPSVEAAQVGVQPRLQEGPPSDGRPPSPCTPFRTRAAASVCAEPGGTVIRINDEAYPCDPELGDTFAELLAENARLVEVNPAP